MEDIILHLKELRQEKVRNDQVLRNVQQERKQLEKKVEAGKLRKIIIFSITFIITIIMCPA